MSDNRVHSRFGGSSITRVINCVGSTAINATVPDAPRRDANEGTVKHDVAERCLKGGGHPAKLIGQKFGDVEFTLDMSNAVVTYLNVISHETAQTATSELFVEQDVVLNIPGAEGEVFSWIDAYVFHHETGRLRVIDFKGGFQEVEVEDCDQLKHYALGVIHRHPEWRIREIILTIVQPGGLNDESVRDWRFTLVDLLEFAGDIEASIAAAKAVEARGVTAADLTPGSWCASTYCPAFAAGRCPAVDAKAMAGLGMDFSGMEPVSVTQVTPDVLPDPSTLDLTQLAKVVDGLDFITTWAGRCQQYLEAMMLSQGAQAPGWKVVDKIGRAAWIDDPKQIVAYADMVFGVEPGQMMPPRLVTITDAVKHLKAAGASKEQIDDFKLKFTIKESTGRTIARASDRRPAVDVVAADFAGVNVTAIAAE